MGHGTWLVYNYYNPLQAALIVALIASLVSTLICSETSVNCFKMFHPAFEAFDCEQALEHHVSTVYKVRVHIMYKKLMI